MRPTVAIIVVGLTQRLLGENTPNISALAKPGGARPLATITPAVTCSVHATFMTGELPAKHGCVANGWYFRDLAEVWLWRQSDRLVAGEKIWEEGRRRDPAFTCAKLFWWYNMHAAVDWAITPRPMYTADGRKLPDVWTEPLSLRDDLTEKLGTFPLFHFWGPTADIVSTRWIADSALHVLDAHRPTLTLVYLPHLDYVLQRVGPDHTEVARHLREVDAECGRIVERARAAGAEVVILSEYGITNVRGPIHINRALREAKLIRCRTEVGRDMIDLGSSDAFAVADHQIAHVYVRDPARVAQVKKLIENLPGVEIVLDEKTKPAFGLDHANAGELIAIASSDHWFTYYFWLDDEKAPDYARTVDIHRKPGYDPAELFLNPKMMFPKLRVGAKVLRKLLGFRYLMDVIPLDAALVKGSHGRVTDDPAAGPLIISTRPSLLPDTPVPATSIKRLLLDHVFG